MEFCVNMFSIFCGHMGLISRGIFLAKEDVY